MKKLSIDLQNCYGISKLKQTFDFSDKNTLAIYASNGTMKTSFTKVFRNIQLNKEKEIKDNIFNKKSKFEIKVDDLKINRDLIFSVNSYESFYESSNLSTLLVNNDMKKIISEILELKKDFYKQILKLIGFKNSNKNI